MATALPRLSRHSIEVLASGWTDIGLWDDIAWLGRRFLTAGADDRNLAWHHFVLAVGNFKRMGGRRLRPPRLTRRAEVGRVVPGDFELPGGEAGERVAVDDPPSWPRLETVLVGAGTPTTTTLLAALWPEDHFVYDWRVHSAANGLRILEGMESTVDVEPDGIAPVVLTFGGYQVVRGWLLATAEETGQPLTHVERALYELSRRVKSQRGRTWRGYAEEVGKKLG